MSFRARGVCDVVCADVCSALVSLDVISDNSRVVCWPSPGSSSAFDFLEILSESLFDICELESPQSCLRLHHVLLFAQTFNPFAQGPFSGDCSWQKHSSFFPVRIPGGHCLHSSNAISLASTMTWSFPNWPWVFGLATFAQESAWAARPLASCTSSAQSSASTNSSCFAGRLAVENTQLRNTAKSEDAGLTDYWLRMTANHQQKVAPVPSGWKGSDLHHTPLLLHEVLEVRDSHWYSKHKSQHFILIKCLDVYSFTF